MKKIKFLYIALITTMLVGSCKQDPIIPETPAAVTPAPASKGTADFTKFVVLGDSYSAGMQGGALFNEGQTSSMAKIMANQFSAVGVGGGAFNQPDINSVNGFNSSASNPAMGIIRGRFILFDPDGATDPDGAGCQVSRSAGPKAAGTPAVATQPTPCSPAITLAVPAPYNTADFPSAFAGDKAALNNFGVPGTRIFHTTAAAFGDPTPGVGNPYYARFASTPGTSLLLTDAASKAGSFFMLYLGNFDILNYATAGAVGNPNGTGSVDMTPEVAVFSPSYTANLNALLATPNSKGVVGTIPDITTLPFFYTVLWNQIEFKVTNCTDAATIASLNAMTAFGGYNAALDALVAGAVPGVTLLAADAAKRKVVYAYGKNPVLISDETLADMTAGLSAISPALGAYGRTRPATATDLLTLSSGAILGTCQCLPPAAPGCVPSASYVAGVSAPLADQFVLLPTEIADIQARTNAFNVIITNAAAANIDRVAVADVNKAYKDLLAAKAMVFDGVTITPSFAPPAGAFSEDGVHPNSRGFAFTANVFISAINAKFGANVYKANVAAYGGTKLPIVP